MELWFSKTYVFTKVKDHNFTYLSIEPSRSLVHNDSMSQNMSFHDHKLNKDGGTQIILERLQSIATNG